MALEEDSRVTEENRIANWLFVKIKRKTIFFFYVPNASSESIRKWKKNDKERFIYLYTY